MRHNRSPWEFIFAVDFSCHGQGSSVVDDAKTTEKTRRAIRAKTTDQQVIGAILPGEVFAQPVSLTGFVLEQGILRTCVLHRYAERTALISGFQADGVSA